MSRYAFCEMAVEPDTAWPADENGERPLVGRHPANGSTVAGWWSRTEYERWAKARKAQGATEPDSSGRFVVTVELTETERRKGWYHARQ